VNILAKDGKLTPYYFTGSRALFEGAPYVLGMGLDVTERKRIEAELRREELMFRTLTENSRDITTVLASDGTISYQSPAVEDILGYRQDELIGRPFAAYLHPDEVDAALLGLGDDGCEGMSRDRPIEFRFRHKAGHYRLLSATGGSVDGMGTVLNSRDITEQRILEEEVSRLALYDGLTNLANRNLFHQTLAKSLEASQRDGSEGLVLFLDIDRFKSVNDALGHQSGDRLLQLASERLRGTLWNGETLARHGGDEFIAIVPGVSLADSVPIVERILEAFRAPFFVAPHQLHITCSVGICAYPQDGCDVSTLIRNADTAMYEAKAGGRNTYRHFTAEMSGRANAALRIANDLHRAVANDEFEVYYQPMVDIGSEKVLGYEALVRWHHPERGLLQAGEFIAVAEEIGLVERIGLYVFDRACRQLRAWHDSGHADLIVAINVSVRQLSDVDFVSQVRQCLERYAVPPRWVEIEITESIFVSDDPSVAATIAGLAESGLGISIDDFGVGYSSLGYLRRLAPTKVKIDRTFVRDMPLDAGAAAIVSAVVSLGRAFHFSVVAEGVETSQELDAARKIGCDQAQGYLFGRPLPSVAIDLETARS